jgi:hypothetical protein
MSLMSMALSMVLLWKTFNSWTWFAIHSLGWSYHNFWLFDVIIVLRSLHSRWSLKACFHQWHHCVYFLVINKCWGFILIFI